MIKLNFDIKKHKLDNNLEVITIKKDTRIGAINIGFNIGSMHEKENEKGVSHFVEHMLFKGTTNLNNEELNSELESLGGEYNAYTDYETTVYTISCLEEELENGTRLLADMVINSDFNKEEIEKERSVILAELRTGKDDIEDLSFKKTNEAAFSKGFLRWEVIGTEKNVNNFKRDDIVEYFSKYYVPGNAVITLVTSLDHEDAVDMVKKYFKDWKDKSFSKIEPVKEKNKKLRKVSYKDDIEQSTIIYLYTFDDLKRNEELPLRILNHRLGESSNSILFREVRENRGYAYDIFTHLDISNDSKNLYIYTSVSDDDVEKTEEVINEIIEKVVNGQISFENRDLEIMKKVHKTAVISTLEDSAELCNYILHQALSKEDLLEFVYDMERLNKIEKEEISEIGKKVFKDATIHILRKSEEE
ncbi:pitrilysin family protein [uncultured Clostridium sp.]|uniref:M16 family metallopeptidase n=1 Tax=uncultured Clostridium sp. TaxID=59620 RepID=UPI00262B270D|nr:pitrilysin family protein [uncultured Clostridium sp.]